MYSTTDDNALLKVFGIIITAYYKVLLGGEIDQTTLKQAKIEYDKIKDPVLDFEHLIYLHAEENVGAADFHLNFDKIVKAFEANRKVSAGEAEIAEDSFPNLHGYIDYYDKQYNTKDFTSFIPSSAAKNDYASVESTPDVESFSKLHIIDILRGDYPKNIFSSITSLSQKMDINPIVTIISSNIVALTRGIGEAFATGLLIHPRFVLTARHSLEEQDIRTLAIKSNFQKNEADIMHFGDLTYCLNIVDENKPYDYAIIQLVENVDFDDSVTFKNHIPNSKVLFFHHPSGGPKKVSCHEVIADGQYETLNLNGYHDTIKGSSGGVYVDADGNVVAMHSLGKQSTEQGEIADFLSTTTGIKIENILQSSEFMQSLYLQNGLSYFFNKNGNVQVLKESYYLDRDSTRISSAEIEAIIQDKPVNYPTITDNHLSSPTSVPWAYHHIIPKGNMEFMWILGKEYPLLNAKLEAIAWQHNKKYYNGELTANSIIWANWNLFIGPEDRPTGKSPGFDPKHGYKIEPAKPLSFPKELWNKITQINTQIEQCFSSRKAISAIRKETVIDSYEEKSGYLKGQYNKVPKYDATKAPGVTISKGAYKTNLDKLCAKLTEIEKLKFTEVTQIYKYTSSPVDSVSTMLMGPWFYKTTNNDWTLDSSGKYLLKLLGSSDVSVSNVMEATPPPPPTTVAFAHIHYENDFLNHPLSEKIISFAYHFGGSRAINEVIELGFESQYSQKYLETSLITSKTSESYTKTHSVPKHLNTNNAIIANTGAALMKIIEVKESIIYICTEIIPIFDKHLLTDKTSFLAKEGLWTMLHLAGGMIFAYSLPGTETLSATNKFLVPLLSTSAYAMRHYYHAEFQHNDLNSEYNNFLYNIILDAGFGALNAVPMAIITANPSLIISGALHRIMISSLSCLENNEISQSAYNIGNIAAAVLVYNTPFLYEVKSFSNAILAINQASTTLTEVALIHKLASKFTDQIINNFYHYYSLFDDVKSNYEQSSPIEVIGNIPDEFDQQE